MCFENSKYTGHQRSCVFLIDHVTESFLDVCILRNFSNLSLIIYSSFIHSFIHFLRIALHSLRYFYVLFSEEERNKSQNKRPVFKYLSLSLNSIVHSLFFYESHCNPLSYFHIFISEEERNKRQNKCPSSNTYLCLLFL